MVYGILFFPIHMLMGHLVSFPLTFNLILWIYLSIYSILMSKWGQAKTSSILFPLGVLFITAFLEISISGFFILSLLLLSWIRSAICFQKKGMRAIFGEVAAGFGGGLLVFLLAPSTELSWALGIFLFSLFQALYFMIVDTSDEHVPDDPFEKARIKAEGILSFWDLN